MRLFSLTAALLILFPASVQTLPTLNPTTPPELIQNVGALIASVDVYSQRCEGGDVQPVSQKRRAMASLTALIELRGWTALQQYTNSESFKASLLNEVLRHEERLMADANPCATIQSTSQNLMTDVDNWNARLNGTVVNEASILPSPSPVPTVAHPEGELTSNDALSRIAQLPPDMAMAFFHSEDCRAVLANYCELGKSGRITFVQETQTGYVYRLNP